MFHTGAVTDDQIHSHGLHNYVTSAKILAAVRLKFRLPLFHIDVMMVTLDAASFAILPGSSVPVKSAVSTLVTDGIFSHIAVTDD